MSLILKLWLILFVLFCEWDHQRLTEIIEFQNDQLSVLMLAQGQNRILMIKLLLVNKGKGISSEAFYSRPRS